MQCQIVLLNSLMLISNIAGGISEVFALLHPRPWTPPCGARGVCLPGWQRLGQESHHQPLAHAPPQGHPPVLLPGFCLHVLNCFLQFATFVSTMFTSPMQPSNRCPQHFCQAMTHFQKVSNYLPRPTLFSRPNPSFFKVGASSFSSEALPPGSVSSGTSMRCATFPLPTLP